MPPSLASVQARIHKNILKLLEGQNREEITRKTGIPRATLARQIQQGRYTLEVVVGLAAYFEVTVGELVDPPPAVPRGEKATNALLKIQRVIERATRG